MIQISVIKPNCSCMPITARKKKTNRLTTIHCKVTKSKFSLKAVSCCVVVQWQTRPFLSKTLAPSFEFVLIDESAQEIEPDCSLPLELGSNHVVLLGDQYAVGSYGQVRNGSRILFMPSRVLSD